MKQMTLLLELIISHRIWRILLLALSATLLLSPLLFRPTFTIGPDLAMHLFNAQRYANEIQAGVWYPRWLGDWYGGYGAPIGVAYPPLTYYGVALLAIAGLPTLAALKIILWISLFASGVIMYKLAVQFIHPAGALLAGLFYQMAPYRIHDLYGRTAFPEYVAFVWLPLVLLLTLYCVRERKLMYHAALAITVAALLMTHFLTAYLFAIVIAPYAIYIVLRNGNRRLMMVLRLAATAGLGALLAAIYWVPAFLENQSLNTDWFQGKSGWGNYLNNFVFNAQVYIGTNLEYMYSENTRIGIAVILATAVGGIALAVNVWAWQRRPRPAREMALVMTAMLAFSILMSLSISRPLWALLVHPEIIGFPWRWQTVTVLAAGYLAGDIAVCIWYSPPRKLSTHWLQNFALPLLFIGALAANMLYSGALMWRYRARVTDQVVEQILGKQPLSVEYYSWVYDDPYLPVWSQNFDYIATPASRRPLIISDAPATIATQQWQSQRRVFTVSASAATTVNVLTFWFPGWNAYINGQPIHISIQPADGTMLLPIPAGRSEVTLVFENTPVRSIAADMSAGAALVLLVLVSIAAYRQFWRPSNERC